VPQRKFDTLMSETKVEFAEQVRTTVALRLATGAEQA